MKKKHCWVLRDLSNGNGAEPGVTRPTYIWVFRYRVTARAHAKEQNDYRARLSGVEKWSLAILHRLYDRVCRNYYRRKA